jgi:1-deoxy-D-xylulose-5-phosphate synthase
MRLLDGIEGPEDFRELSIKDLETLAQEIREAILDVVSQTGGHLAPSLGVVELTLALHYVFHTPEDKIVWDVGHQAYAHKLVTGRKGLFHTLRQYGGISGFPKPSESLYDAFATGHSSTSLSAALGLAVARDFQGKGSKVVAVIGDGSMTAGLAFEGLNHAGQLDRDLVVILNDNEMCISPTKGALSHYLSRRMADPRYLHFREEIKRLAAGKPGGDVLLGAVRKFEESVKGFFTPGILFEELGFKYVGPVRGHHLGELVRTLEAVKKAKEPILVHVLTRKGKGYEPAEREPHRFHGVGPFHIETGESKAKGKISYTQAFSQALLRLAEEDDRVVAITAAMPDGTGLTPFARRFPQRFFDVGIAEQHAVTFAAGLAAQGMRPVVAVYSTFLQRAYDQIIHDVALQNLPVTFALDRGGLVGADGPTHHGVFDLSYLRCVPRMVLMAPGNEEDLARMLKTALTWEGPIALRYSRGEATGVGVPREIEPMEVGKGELVREGKDLVLLVAGHLLREAREAVGLLEERGINPALVNARFVKPLDKDLILQWATLTGRVVTLEENAILGGFGSAVLELLAEEGVMVPVLNLGIPDDFVTHGSLRELRKDLGLDGTSLAYRIQEWIAGASEGEVVSLVG